MRAQTLALSVPLYASLSLLSSPPIAQVPSGFETVRSELSQSETAYAALQLPAWDQRDPPVHLHASQDLRVIARIDAEGFVVDSQDGTRLHYDVALQSLSYDEGAGPVTLPTESSVKAAGLYTELRSGFSGSLVSPVNASTYGIVPKPHERWFRVAPQGSWSTGFLLLVGTREVDGTLSRFALRDPSGKAVTWRGFSWVADLDQIDLDVPLEPDMRSRQARRWSLHGTPAAWQDEPAREDADLIWHERLEHSVLRFNASLGQPAMTPHPEPMTQVREFTCSGPGVKVQESRQFVWDVDTTAPSFPVMEAAMAQGCVLTLAATANITSRLAVRVDGLVELRAIARDVRAPSVNLWAQTRQIQTTGPGNAFDAPSFSWTLPPNVSPRYLQIFVNAKVEGTCRSASSARSTLRAELEGLGEPVLTWACPAPPG